MRASWTKPLSIVFFPYIYIAYIYLVLRLILPLSLRRATRIGIALAVFLVCQHHLIQKLITGTMFSPEIPRVFVILLGFLYCTFFLSLLLTLVMDIGLLLAWALRRGRALDATLTQRLRYAVVALGTLLAAVGVSQAIAVPEVRRVELAIRDLPPGLDGFRMVQLSDLHISRLMDAGWTRQVVERSTMCSRWPACAPGTAWSPAWATTNIISAPSAGPACSRPSACGCWSTAMRRSSTRARR